MHIAYRLSGSATVTRLHEKMLSLHVHISFSCLKNAPKNSYRRVSVITFSSGLEEGGNEGKCGNTWKNGKEEN
jgi:hypothetical protein